MEAGTKKVRIEERDKAKKVEAKAKRVRIEERNKARKVNTMTQAKKMDDSKRPPTNDIDSERYKARKVKSTMEYVNLWNYYKVYGNSWSVISRECYQSKIKRDALRQRFGGGAFRKFVADKYGHDAYFFVLRNCTCRVFFQFFQRVGEVTL